MWYSRIVLTSVKVKCSYVFIYMSFICDTLSFKCICEFKDFKGPERSSGQLSIQSGNSYYVTDVPAALTSRKRK